MVLPLALVSTLLRQEVIGVPASREKMIASADAVRKLVTPNVQKRLQATPEVIRPRRIKFDKILGQVEISYGSDDQYFLDPKTGRCVGFFNIYTDEPEGAELSTAELRRRVERCYQALGGRLPVEVLSSQRLNDHTLSFQIAPTYQGRHFDDALHASYFSILTHSGRLESMRLNEVPRPPAVTDPAIPPDQAIATVAGAVFEKSPTLELYSDLAPRLTLRQPIPIETSLVPLVDAYRRVDAENGSVLTYTCWLRVQDQGATYQGYVDAVNGTLISVYRREVAGAEPLKHRQGMWVDGPYRVVTKGKTATAKGATLTGTATPSRVPDQSVPVCLASGSRFYSARFSQSAGLIWRGEGSEATFARPNAALLKQLRGLYSTQAKPSKSG